MKQSKIIVIALLVMICVIPAFAGNNNGNKGDTQCQGQGQAQGQIQGQGQAQSQMALSNSKACANASSLALQGQVAVSEQGNCQEVNVGGDDADVLAYSAGSLTTALGTSGLNAGTPWGSIAIGNTERYEVLVSKASMLMTFAKAGLIDLDEAKAFATSMIFEMEEESKPKRLFGCLYRTDGCNLSNLFGILSWRSFRDE